MGRALESGVLQEEFKAFEERGCTHEPTFLNPRLIGTHHLLFRSKRKFQNANEKEKRHRNTANAPVGMKSLRIKKQQLHAIPYVPSIVPNPNPLVLDRNGLYINRVYSICKQRVRKNDRRVQLLILILIDCILELQYLLKVIVVSLQLLILYKRQVKQCTVLSTSSRS